MQNQAQDAKVQWRDGEMDRWKNFFFESKFEVVSSVNFRIRQKET